MQIGDIIYGYKVIGRDIYDGTFILECMACGFHQELVDGLEPYNCPICEKLATYKQYIGKTYRGARIKTIYASNKQIRVRFRYKHEKTDRDLDWKQFKRTYINAEDVKEREVKNVWASN